jgi:predicted ATPase
MIFTKKTSDKACQMPERTIEFESLPEAYQQVLHLAQDRHKISVQPLQVLVGGWSGAMVYLVSVAYHATGKVEHCILKLDRKSKSPKADEVTRHQNVLGASPPEFVRKYVPELVFDRIEGEGAVAIFYRIAGQSLLQYLPLSRFGQQNQLKAIFTETNSVLLSRWNPQPSFTQVDHPHSVLKHWLGFRLDGGRPIEDFLGRTARVNPDIPGFLINGDVYPNPLRYARTPEPWGRARPMDIATGMIHGDLNTNNILVKFAENAQVIEGYYLIDFALFKQDMPLLYDQRYLEMSYLMLTLSQVPFGKLAELLGFMGKVDILDPQNAPIEMAGAGAVIAAARQSFVDWVDQNHPSLHDDLWGQYWLAGAAAGLSYTHKAGLPDEQRLAGLIYAAANLKRFCLTFNLPLPTQVELLYDQHQSIADTPGKSILVRPQHTLPTQPTRFIGRAAQLGAIKVFIDREDVRLVTLLGPGGTGKTRLSIQAAHDMLERFPDGVTFVPLADDTDGDQFVSRVAQRLNVRQGGRPLQESVQDYLYDKRALLILDNFEQLMSAAPIVAELLVAAPKVKMIVTSRTALNLMGEQVFPVPPLGLPGLQDEVAADSLMDFEAVHLFVERAQAVQPNFSLNQANAGAIAEICRRLDGLPLALELAAARVRILTPGAILNRLDDALKLLTGGARDLPSRHQALRNTLMWSYDLLKPDEQTLFARLGVFVGGFTLEAAETVCNPDGDVDILEGLTSLVDNSLIRQEETNIGEVRFNMLETIRAYAQEQLTAMGELKSSRERHARYFGEVAVNRIGNELYSEKALYWLDWLECEFSNMRATLDWCLGQTGDIELAVEIVFALTWFFYRRGYFIEGLTWAERILLSPSLQEPSPLRALAQQTYGILAVWKGEQDKGLAQIEESLAILGRTEEDGWIAPVLISKAVALINMGRDQDAQPLLVQAQALFKEMGFDYFLTITLVHLGNVELGLGHPGEAQRVLEEARSIARTLNEPWILSFVLNNLGEVARTQGQYELARTYYEECEGLLGITGDRGDMARFVHSLGYIAQHAGDLDRAESQFRESLKLFRRLGNRRGIAESLAGLAGLKARGGHHRWGTTLLGAAETLLQSTGGAWWPADRVEVEHNRQMMQSALSHEEFMTAWAVGEAMGIDQALQFAADGP